MESIFPFHGSSLNAVIQRMGSLVSTVTISSTMELDVLINPPTFNLCPSIKTSLLRIFMKTHPKAILIQLRSPSPPLPKVRDHKWDLRSLYTPAANYKRNCSFCDLDFRSAFLQKTNTVAFSDQKNVEIFVFVKDVEVGQSVIQTTSKRS